MVQNFQIVGASMTHTRRLLALFSPMLLAAQEHWSQIWTNKHPRPQKYAVTFPHRNGCFVDPIWVEAGSRVEALHNCGATVWTKEEWDAVSRKELLKEMMQKYRCVAEGKEPKA